VPLSSPF
jgi:hypothetical protein